MSTEKLDTGLPGFLVDGRLHHLSPGAPNRVEEHPEVSPVEKQGQISSFADPNYPEIVDAAPLLDVAKSTRNTLAAYLGRQTSRRNYIPVDEPNSPIDTDPSTALLGNETRLMGANNVVPDIKPTNNTRFFVEKKKLDSQGSVPSRELWGWMGGNRPGAIVPEPISPPTKNLETASGPVSLVKGQQEGWNSGSDDFISGNDILSDKANAQELRRTYVSAVLKNNRFTPMPPENEKYRASHDLTSLTPKKTKESIGDTRTVDDQGNILAQTWMGNSQIEYTQVDSNELDGERYNPVLYHPKYGGVTMGRLAQIGASLSLRGSLELFSSDAKQDPNSTSSEAAALLPSPNQMGMTKIRQELLEAKNILDNLTLNEIDGDQYVSISQSSWGAMNNIHDQFSGLTALGQMASSIGLSLLVGGVLGGLFEGLSSLIKKGPDQIFNERNDGGRENYMGSYSGEGPFGDTPDFSKFLKKFFGLNDTVFALDEAIDKGISIFYGFDGADNFLSALGSMAKTAVINSIFASGQSMIVSRAIIRGVRSIVSAIANAVTSFSINPIDGIKSILGFIEAFASSKLIGAFNVFSAIGDAALLGEELSKKNATSEPDPSIDRLGSGRQLKWSTRASPSLFLNENLGAKLAIKSSGLGVSKGVHDAKTLKENVRISTSLRESMESQLDGTYVPFYFHDLRTNEIISFHAFLTSLTDGFSVNYDSTEGFGRVEPVKTYKGTQRKIGLEFILAATSEDDFDDMWGKVNKLTMLLYPQYTEGRRLATESGYNFVQPFSQMIGASPLIRLRLGNLFRSNYSRFALAKLFGAGLEDVSFKEEKKAKSAPKNQIEEKPYLEDKENKYFQEMREGSIFGVDIQYKQIEFATRIKGVKNKFFQHFNDVSFYLPFFRVLESKILKIDEQFVTLKVDPSLLKLSEEQKKNLIKSTYPANAPAGGYTMFEVKLAWDKKITESMKGGFDITVPREALLIPQKIKDQFKRDLASENKEIEKSNQESVEANNFSEYDFFKPENNSLVKSFKSAGGKGLAGVIESMDFNWYEQTMWDIRPEAKAPQMCKINISFAPIHDISPGLDSRGNNRAPIYPVGAYKPISDDFDSLWGPGSTPASGSK